MIRGRKDKGGTSANGEQSWRTLAGGRQNSRVRSSQARKRRKAQIIKLLAALLGLCAIIAGIVWAVMAFTNSETAIQIATPSKPVEQVIYDTDGVLPPSWLGSVIELRRETTLLEVDIYAIKQQLEAHGQVKSASVKRQFPSSLKIKINEHEPVLRMRVMGSDDQPELRIVSREGSLYEGIGYPRATLDRLPFVVPYRHPEGGVLPLRGIDRVADLLEETRRTHPSFFKTWELVSLEHYTGDVELPGQVIEVRTTMVPRIIFGLNLDFAQQLDRLGIIIQYVQNRGDQAIKRIDLSLQDSAAVQFESGRISTF